jgi:hypothetical protein
MLGGSHRQAAKALRRASLNRCRRCRRLSGWSSKPQLPRPNGHDRKAEASTSPRQSVNGALTYPIVLSNLHFQGYRVSGWDSAEQFNLSKVTVAGVPAGGGGTENLWLCLVWWLELGAFGYVRPRVIPILSSRYLYCPLASKLTRPFDPSKLNYNTILIDN